MPGFINIVRSRKLPGRAGEKREYWCQKALQAIDGMDSTIPGYLPEEFQELSVTFHKIVERELKLLMDGFVWEDNNERI